MSSVLRIRLFAKFLSEKRGSKKKVGDHEPGERGFLLRVIREQRPWSVWEEGGGHPRITGGKGAKEERSKGAKERRRKGGCETGGM